MTTTVRTDLGGTVGSAPTTAAGESLLGLVHISDLHVLDASSPARAEWVELEADDPAFAPLLHMHRPYDTLTAFALHAHVDTIRNNPVAPTSGRPYDLIISTGDNIDNAQRNELDAYLALICGGVARLDAAGSAQDPSATDLGDVWPYWSPDPEVNDRFRQRGYPAVEDFVARASAPISSAGLGMPWTAIPGNHDLMRQGTALPNAALDRLAVGASKSLRRPEPFPAGDPVSLYLERPEEFSVGPSYSISPDAGRRAIDRVEWLQAHIAAGAWGYTDDHLRRPHVDTIIDLDHVRLIMLDTNHPQGDFDGSIGVDQLAWLDERLTEVDREVGRVAILASHHGTDTLVNDLGHPADRRLAASINEVIHRHRSAIAWLVGHRHINRIESRRGAAGGYWEITTCSTIDFPSQVRAVELLRHRDGTLELACTMLDHADSPDGLASLHRDLTRRFAGNRRAEHLAGRDVDRDVRLVVPPR